MPSKSTSKVKIVIRREVSDRFLFRYRSNDTVTGVSRRTMICLAKILELTETQAIHLALARFAQEMLPRYEADDTPLTERQLKAIGRLEPQGLLAIGENLFA